MTQRTRDQAPLPPTEERPSFEEVHAREAAYVCRTLRRYGVVEADLPDAMQDVFVIVDRRLPTYEPRNRLRGWLRTIVASVAGEYRRKRRREDFMDRNVDVTHAAEHPTCTPPDLSERSARRELAIYLLQQVEPERLRPILIMHDLEEMRCEDIAEELGLTKDVVEKRLQRARAEFQAAWERLQAVVRRQTRGATIQPLCSTFALLEAEREIPPLSKEALEASWTRLNDLVDVGGTRSRNGETSASSGPGYAIAPGNAARTALNTSGGRFGHGLGLGLVVGLIVGGLSARLPSSRETRADTFATTQSAPTAPQGAATSASVALSARASLSAAPSVQASMSLSASGKETKEAWPLHKAAAALADGDTARAFADLSNNAQRNGDEGARLRKRLWIETLLRGSRMNEARAEIELFARDFPDDAKLPAFRAAVTGSP
jgi:RNA polymerase sigma-70 factor (ECF subfamily)